MLKIRNSLVLFSLIFTSAGFAEDAKKEEVKKEEVKKEEVKKEEPKKVEHKKAVAVEKPKECHYQTGSLATIDAAKYDDEVKMIQDKFEKCEQSLVVIKEQQAKAAECRGLNKNLKEMKDAIMKLSAEPGKLGQKEDFLKLAASIKAAKNETASFEAKYVESCFGKTKPTAKKEEPAKLEPTKVEAKKVEPAKVEVKKVEPVKEEVKKVEPVKEEPVKVEVKKVEPAKVEVKKVEPAKEEVKKAEPVKEEVKKEEPKQESAHPHK
jgi:hypothetical protein